MRRVSENPCGWFAANAVAAQSFRTVLGEIDADVCIIGASPAGLTAARDLTRRGWSVVLLERGRVGSDPSAQSLGVVAAGFSESLDRIVARLGVDRARQLWALSAEGAAQVAATIAETGMEGVTPVAGELIVQTRDDAETASRMAAQLRFFGADAEVWTAEQVREALRGPRYFQGVHRRDAFSIHPLNYLRGLAASVDQAGGRIFENAEVVSIDIEGVRKEVRTAAGKVRATHVILASDAESARLRPSLAGTTVAFARPMAAIAPLPQALAVAIGFSGAISHATRGGLRYRVHGSRVIWASPLSAGQGVPWGFGRRVAHRLAGLYPMLRGAEVIATWAAPARYAAHKMPQIAELGPNLWLLGGFGEQALATATMGGTLVARAIAKGDEQWRLFAPYGLTWTGGALGRAAASLAMRSRRAGHAIGDAFARRGLFAPRPAPTLALPAPSLLALPAPQAADAAEIAAPAPTKPKRKRPARKAKPAGEEKVAGIEASAPRPRSKRALPAPTDVIRAKRVRRPKVLVPAPAPKTNGHSLPGDADDHG